MQEAETFKISYQLEYDRIKQKYSDFPKLPIAKKKLDAFLKNIQVDDRQAYNDIQNLNKIAIEEKFIKMMDQIFNKIQPDLPKYQKYKSIDFLDPIIVQNLDRQIYHKGYKLHKSKQTPMSDLLIDREIDITNRLFNEIFDIMNQLLKTMKIFYGYEEDQSISQALYQAIGRFIQHNQQSFLLQQDRLSLALQEQQRENKKKKNNKQTSSYQIIVDVLQAISKEDKSNTGLISKASKFVGVFYKYGISPAVDTVYDSIKSINPLAKTQKISKQQQEKLKMELINNLLPHISVKQPVEEKLVTLLIRLVPMSIQQILKTMGNSEIQRFTTIITQVLNDFQNPNKSFQPIVKELMQLLNLALCSASQQSDQFYSDLEEGKWIILLYKAFEKNYSADRRRLLLTICRFPQICQKIQNPVGILKLIESQSIPQSPLLKKLRELSVSTSELQNSESNKIQITKNQEISLSIQHQLHRIHLYEFKKKYKAPPLLQFQKLTNHSPKRTITFFFSGFMSQDTSKVDEWSGLLDSVYDSQIYSIRWQSKSYGDVFDFAVQAGKDIAKANLSIGFLGQIGGPYLRAVAIIRELYKKYHSNPFNPAFESAEITGQFLSNFIMANFQGYFVNFVGFSLGTQLIKNVVKKLQKKKCSHMINKLYLMGGVADKTQLQQILQNSDTPLSILNMYSNNDSTLKYFLKLCKPDIQPIGLYPLREDITGHIVQNQDCTNIIDGHLAYRKNLKILDKLMNIKDD